MMKLAEWMIANGKTDEALAELVSVTRSQINRIKNGKSRPTPRVARELERITKIPAGAFALGDAGRDQDAQAA